MVGEVFLETEPHQTYLFKSFKKTGSWIKDTIMVIIFWDFLMSDQNFLSPKAKRSVVTSNKHGIYELSDKLPNDLRIRILENQEISRKSWNFIEL